MIPVTSRMDRMGLGFRDRLEYGTREREEAMSRFVRTRKAFGAGAAVALLVAAAPMAGQEAPAGQEKKMVFEEQDTMATVLKRLEGKAVRLRLAGGADEVVGKLQKVGKELAHLSDLSGREYFDAVVRIDQVAGFSVQVRTR